MVRVLASWRGLHRLIRANEMTLRKLDKSEWHAYCDRLSKDLVGSRSGSATVSLAVNHEAIAKWVPLLGIAYEPKKDLFEIILQDLEHWVHHPQTFYEDEGPRGVAGLEIIDAQGLRHTLSLFQSIKFTRMAKE
jgi:hypothetical protein